MTSTVIAHAQYDRDPLATESQQPFEEIVRFYDALIANTAVRPRLFRRLPGRPDRV
jgi:hypothetical protein